MSRDSNPDGAERRVLRHEARTVLNHLLGYAGILGGDAEEAALGSLAATYRSVTEAATSLKEKALLALADPAAGPEAGGDAATTEREVYGLLFDIVSRVQAARSLAGADQRFAPDTDKILGAANRLIELFEEGFHGRAEDDEGIEGFRRRPAEGEAPTRDPAGRMRGLEGLEEAQVSRASLTGRILVADDDPLNRELLERHLSRQGHEVRSAGNGSEALAWLGAERFDLLILDLMMPGVSGFQVLEQLRSLPGADDLRVIVISALDDTASIARCIQLGAEDYLPRDFEPVILRARIESCLEKRNLKRKEALWLAAATESARRLQAELQEGAAYVRSLLPPPARSPGFAADWIYIPSLSLGGDVFGYHRIAASRRAADRPADPSTSPYALYLIDVSGHGIQAALYSVTLMNLLKTQTLAGADFADPSSVLARLNDSFRMEEQNNLYFTAWYGVWEPSTRRLSWSSAGSPPAILITPEGGSSRLVSEGMIVGVSEDAEYRTYHDQLPYGSSLYLFSDGIYETSLREGGILGLDAFSRILVAGAGRSDRGEGDSFLPALIEEIRGLSAEKRFEDDVSLLEFRFA